MLCLLRLGALDYVIQLYGLALDCARQGAELSFTLQAAITSQLVFCTNLRINIMMLDKLIEEIRKYPCLWNRALEEYRNLTLRDNAWANISGKFNKPVKDLKGEWKKLQECYRQAMLRRRSKGANNMKPWKYEAQMSFLLSEIITQETQSCIREDETSFELQDSWGLTVDAENDVELEERSESEIGSKKSRKDLNKCRRCVKKEDSIDKVITFLKEERRGGKQGELDYFFASACASTKCLPRRLQLRVKQQIMSVILKAEMECLDSEKLIVASPLATMDYLSP